MNNYKKGIFLSILFLLISNPAMAHFLPNFECTLTDNGHATQNPHNGNNAGYFFKNYTKDIFLICESNTVSRNDSIRAVWIHEEPTEYRKVAEKKMVVKHDLNDVDVFKTRFVLPNDDHRLATGEYHVRLYINGIEGNAYYFKVR